MNRAQRRLFERAPAGQFQGELRNRARTRAYQAMLRDRMTEEANGAPVDPQHAARMTKPRETEVLFQVGVTDRATKETKFLGPMMNGDAVGAIVADINKQILNGQRHDWTHAEAYPMTRVQGV